MAHSVPSPATNGSLPESGPQGGRLPGFSPLALLECITPRHPHVSPAWVFRAWQERGIKYVADVLRVKGLSFFCWFAVSLTVLLCPDPLIRHSEVLRSANLTLSIWLNSASQAVSGTQEIVYKRDWIKWHQRLVMGETHHERVYLGRWQTMIGVAKF